MKKIMCVGGSRGLGFEFVLQSVVSAFDPQQNISTNTSLKILIISRNFKTFEEKFFENLNLKLSELDSLDFIKLKSQVQITNIDKSYFTNQKKEVNFFENMQETEILPIQIYTASFDVWNAENQKNILDLYASFLPQELIYFAGGGPYGLFQSKEWKDHLWALEVSFLFPAKLLHFILKHEISNTSKTSNGLKKLDKLIFIGSSVCEDSPDPKATSYSASKHGLKGLILSVLSEQKLAFDLGLFSPSYFDSGLLPKNAQINENKRVWKVSEVANRLVHWMESDIKERPHFRWPD